jgi:phage FluMu protein Com
VYLRNKGYSFIEKDINKDMAARNEFIKLGVQRVPTFLIGNDVVVGLNTAKIEELIDYVVISCPECKSRLRIPKGKGKIKVNCPKCKYVFKLST